MAKVTVRTNGQTLLVNASISHWTTAALAVTASGTNDVESSTTTTITADYDMHFSNIASTATITVTQPDGTTLYSGVLNVTAGTGDRVLNPVPDPYQLAADVGLSVATQHNVTGQETVPRWAANTVATQSTGVMYFSHLTATKTESIGSIRFIGGSTAAAATPTLVRFGLFTVGADAGYTLVASTVNDTALFAVASTSTTKAVSTPYTVTRGIRYAVGCLVVTGAAAPTVQSCALGSTGGAMTSPTMVTITSGLSDLPATLAVGSVATAATMPYAALIPA
jgi:hypothetical protein